MPLGAVRVLDSAMGSELERRGTDCSPPLWSARALVGNPDLVRQIHRENVEAGAGILTANTFRAGPRAVAKAGSLVSCRELSAIAVRLAREAAGGADVAIAGSIAPVEDCYRPDPVPADEELAVEHREMARALAEAGADLLLIETMNTVRELAAACRAAAATELPVLASVVTDGRGFLLSGEPIEEAAETARRCGVAAFGVNCIPPAAVAAELSRLSGLGIPLIAYANTLSTGEDSETYASFSEEWARRGAQIVGGCCGTRAEHVASMKRKLEPLQTDFVGDRL
jgi:S-methylmethionine-dependent homocysteine/selenocysteine methylase